MRFNYLGAFVLLLTACGGEAVDANGTTTPKHEEAQVVEINPKSDQSQPIAPEENSREGSVASNSDGQSASGDQVGNTQAGSPAPAPADSDAAGASEADAQVSLKEGALGTVCNSDDHQCAELCLAKDGPIGVCSTECEMQGLPCTNPIPGAPDGLCVNDEFPGESSSRGYCEFFCKTDRDCEPFGTFCGEVEPHGWIEILAPGFATGICRPAASF